MGFGSGGQHTELATPARSKRMGFPNALRVAARRARTDSQRKNWRPFSFRRSRNLDDAEPELRVTAAAQEAKRPPLALTCPVDSLRRM